MSYTRIKDSICVRSQSFLDKTLPLCDKGVLDIKNHLKGRCQMKWFNKKDIVNCIDALSGEAVMSRNESNYLNLVFIGDSRVRQIFFDFVKVFDCLLKNALL